MLPILLALAGATAWMLGTRDSRPRADPWTLAEQAIAQHRAHHFAAAGALPRPALALHEAAATRANLARSLAANGQYAEAARTAHSGTTTACCSRRG